MKFGYTIIYVQDVKACLEFYQRAFGMKERFYHDSGDYGELDTGETVLAFASHALGHSNLPGGYIKSEASASPLGYELGFVTDDVSKAFTRALEAGAEQMTAPKSKPWGQVVGYVRTPEGTVIEICSPVAG